jgi:D-alanyl-D-alanine endopeptidase (penicillin-binding protein 7)
MNKLIWLVLFLLPLGSAAVPITAQSWLVATGDGKIIDGANIKESRSIASITKLVTVMVVLDAKQDPNERLTKYTRSELIQLALVKSDNTAAKKLCDTYPGGDSRCIAAMNYKMHSMGLSATKFVEPTGLSVMNISTAEELVTIVLEAQKYPAIVEASRSSQIKIKIRKQWLVFNNTNPIIGKRHDFIVSKTGYIRASGGCIVMLLDTDIGRRLVVVLGSKNTHTRIPEAEFIANNY